MDKSENTKFRQLSGVSQGIFTVIAILIPLLGVFFILDVWMILFKRSLYNQQYLSLFVGLLMFLLFMKIPARKNSSMTKIPWYDWIMAGLSLGICLYVCFDYAHIQSTMGVISTFRIILGAVFILLVLEATRRSSGWVMVILIVVFLLYGKFGNLIPGSLGAPKATWGRFITQMFLGSEAMFGVAVRTVASVVFAFILYANVLFATGGGNFLMDLASSAFGRFRGGTAKVSILTSMLFGMISGSPVGNVAATGSFTIPAMKEKKYPAAFAGAIAAVASTGGNIMPPILGATAFLVAEYASVPYTSVVLVSIIPALFYYMGLFVQADLHAVKYQIDMQHNGEKKKLREVLKEGWIYLLSIIVLLCCLFVLKLRAQMAALITTAVLIVFSFIYKKTRLTWNKTKEFLIKTSMGMIQVIVICAAAGIIIGVVNYTGLGFSLSNILTNMVKGHLLPLAIMAAVVSIILGCGVPPIVSFTLLSVLVVPAMINMGVPTLIAHFFIFYYGVFTYITPPFCLSVFTSASIAGAGMFETAWPSLRLSIAGLIAPFIMLFQPGLVFQGAPLDCVISIGTTFVCVLAICFALEGFMLQKLALWKRIAFLVAAVGLLFNNWIAAIGGAIFVILIVIQIIENKKRKTS